MNKDSTRFPPIVPPPPPLRPKILQHSSSPSTPPPPRPKTLPFTLRVSRSTEISTRTLFADNNPNRTLGGDEMHAAIFSLRTLLSITDRQLWNRPKYINELLFPIAITINNPSFNPTLLHTKIISPICALITTPFTPHNYSEFLPRYHAFLLLWQFLFFGIHANSQRHLDDETTHTIINGLIGISSTLPISAYCSSNSRTSSLNYSIAHNPDYLFCLHIAFSQLERPCAHPYFVAALQILHRFSQHPNHSINPHVKASAKKLHTYYARLLTRSH